MSCFVWTDRLPHILLLGAAVAWIVLVSALSMPFLQKVWCALTCVQCAVWIGFLVCHFKMVQVHESTRTAANTSVALHLDKLMSELDNQAAVIFKLERRLDTLHTLIASLPMQHIPAVV